MRTPKRNSCGQARATGPASGSGSAWPSLIGEQPCQSDRSLCCASAIPAGRPLAFQPSPAGCSALQGWWCLPDLLEHVPTGVGCVADVEVPGLCRVAAGRAGRSLRAVWGSTHTGHFVCTLRRLKMTNISQQSSAEVGPCPVQDTDGITGDSAPMQNTSVQRRFRRNMHLGAP